MFKTKSFLEDQFKTPRGLRHFLSAYGVNVPGPSTVQKWFLRESMPSHWLGLCVSYLEIENGGPVSLAKYVGSAR